MSNWAEESADRVILRFAKEVPPNVGALRAYFLELRNQRMDTNYILANTRDSHGNNMVHLAVRAEPTSSSNPGLEILNIIDEFAFPQTKAALASAPATRELRTPLMRAIFHHRSVPFITKLLYFNPSLDISARDDTRNTVIHYAVIAFNTDTFRHTPRAQLLQVLDKIAQAWADEGYSLNVPGRDNFTPAHLAAKYGHLDALRILVRLTEGNCLHETLVTSHGRTVLQVARHYGWGEMVRYIESTLEEMTNRMLRGQGGPITETGGYGEGYDGDEGDGYDYSDDYGYGYGSGYGSGTNTDYGYGSGSGYRSRDYGYD